MKPMLPASDFARSSPESESGDFPSDIAMAIYQCFQPKRSVSMLVLGGLLALPVFISTFLYFLPSSTYASVQASASQPG